MRTPSPPPAPDPAIQTANEAAANRYNIVSPFGNQTWTSNGQEQIGVDSNGRPIMGQQYTQNIELNPSEQRQYDLRNQIAELTMGQGLEGIEGGLPGFSDLEANPGRPGSISAPVAPSSYRAPSIDNQGRPTQFSINGDTPAAARAHYDRIAEALDPTFERQTNRFEQRMNNAGLPVGSEAYNDAFGEVLDQQNRTMRDAAYESAIRSPELALMERQQQMADRGQYFGEDVTRFDASQQDRARQMAERGQLFGEDLAATADERAGFSQYQDERTRQFNEDLARRQNFYNEIAAALGGQQLNPINAGGGGGDANLDVAGAFQQYNQANQNVYNQRTASRNALLQAMAGMGSSAIKQWG